MRIFREPLRGGGGRGHSMYRQLIEFEAEEMQLAEAKCFPPWSRKTEEERIWRNGSGGRESGPDVRPLGRRALEELKIGGANASSVAPGTGAEKRTSGETQNMSLESLKEGVVGRAFSWINDKVKEHTSSKIQRTYFRERTEGGELYVQGRRVFTAAMIKSRAEREREKREALQRLERNRLEVERRMRRYLAKRRLKMEALGRHAAEHQQRRDDADPEWRLEYNLATEFRDTEPHCERGETTPGEELSPGGCTTPWQENPLR
ncbi:hypothetical protein NHX12_020823 [Muraenolepis orangiensis]|uniref:Uncharacterized protein n=1 Tax=Muraenolepis orangiensis TaxID=630683 RepID=A0A9Q0ITC6_9TELE|nr:hypothetical protein NHX12_020823 [Muraenolepis orangiensis]